MDPQPVEFGLPGPVRDRLVAAIRDGRKTATSSLLVEYQLSGERLPRANERGTVIDSAGAADCVIETTDVRVSRLADVDHQHALDEGEGFAGVADWRAAHEAFWRSPDYRAAAGGAFELTDDTLVVLEEFRVVGRE